MQSPYLLTFMEPRNRFRQAGNRFLGSLKRLQIRAQVKLAGVSILAAGGCKAKI